MYQLVSAIAKANHVDARWSAVEIGSMPMSTIFTTYREIYAVLSNPLLTANVSLNFEDIRNVAGGLPSTFNDYLIANGANTLPTSDTIPEINTQYVNYADAFHAGYDVEPVHSTYDPSIEVPPGDKLSLLLSKTGVDYNFLYQNAMVSVNGFFHLTDYMPQGLKVYNGNKSRMLSHQNQCGIYSFRNVGSLTFIPITADMVYKQSPQGRYKDQMYVDLGVDPGNQTVCLVLGGYLHVLDSLYYQVGEQQFCIDFANFSFAKRYYESRDFIDLSSLGLSQSDRNDQMLNIPETQSDAVLLAYATLSQSFFVLVNTNDLYTDFTRLTDHGLPGMYIAYEQPVYPLRIGFGRMAEYWYTEESPQWAVNTYPIVTPNYLFQTVDITKENNIDAGRLPSNPAEVSRAFWWKIAKDF